MDSVLIVDRYALDEWLASGAIGLVFRGYDPLLDRPVAIKILHRELARGEAAEAWRERFKGRARAAGRLFHPNIPAVFDFAEDHEIPFVTMEYVDGSRLDRMLKTEGRFTPERAVVMALQVLDALEYSHQNGVLHLDLKSSIVLALADDHVKVVDFGTPLARASELPIPEEAPHTVSSRAPEQLTGGAVDHRADLFMVGGLLYEMLTCERPFRDAGIDQVVTEMATRRAEDVCALNPGVSRGLGEVIATALAYDPAERFASAAEFSRALRDALSSTQASQSVMRSPVAPACGRDWDAGILHKVEAELAAHIGPVAAIAVKRATEQATDIVGLCEELAVYLVDEREREKFLAAAIGLAAAGPGPNGPSQDNSEDTTRRERDAPEPPDPAVLAVIEAKLAEHVGPIAHILLKRQMQQFRSIPELYLSLADHISDAAERTRFLNSGRI